MAKQFEDMSPEEKKEAFNKWVTAKKRVNEDPIDLTVETIEEALWHFIPEANQEAAHEELVEALSELFLTVEEETAEAV